ncbi:MAG: hypothetical protein IKJ70_02825 [Clostridia bacterium]|nr:hypothetical protein [Clostridia bacterium]
MKKLIALILVVVLSITMMTPIASAVDANDTPVVILRGDGVSLTKIDENGQEVEVYPVGLDSIDGKVGETAKNILIPFLTEGLLFDKWDNYYEVCYEELSPIMAEVVLDDNGNPRNQTGIGTETTRDNRNSCKVDRRHQSKYGATDYTFYYDWRLSPYDIPTGETKSIVDLLHEYIGNVSKANGNRKVTLAGNCLGGSYVLAYLQKYGDAGLIKNVFFNATTGNGTSILTDVFCGDIELDAKAIQRFADEYIDADADTLAGFVDTAPVINDLVLKSVDLAVQLGLLDDFAGKIGEIYQKVYEVLVPMLVIAFYGTMPGYWTMIEPERFEEAKNFVFGPEGSEYRVKYAKIIEKIDYYFNTVGFHKKAIIKACQDKDIHFGATAKYGIQMYPFVKSQDQLADEKVDFENASFGATVAKSVYEVLPTSHIDAAIAAGNEKYISPDKQIDASTSLFKDTLWVEKNMSHDAWRYDYEVIEAFASNDKFTVWSDPNLPQFVIRIPGTGEIDPDTGREDHDTSTVEKMVADNSDNNNWQDTPEDSKTPEKPTVASRLVAFFRWLTAMFKFILHISNDNPGSLEDAIN